MKYVITGGCGFIGWSFSSLLLKDKSNFVRVYDNLSNGTAESRLGWKSKVSLRDGLKQTVRDFL